ncbi:GIY-YIG nuclease family protein [Pectinatus sottacetonis]|uniref:GIY-YIG nuclease family protein n=1 Tax=Pectinatus sottacetonis TaxID=1002795 RepID=UPI0018C5FB23|nr:GIY-YIG nuclease family protein [Pectinatus sottacetonis]
MNAYTYLLCCNDGSFYAGWTNNLQKRIAVHNKGKGARYTRVRLPVKLVYYEIYTTKIEAMRREYAIKQLKHMEKLKLCESFPKTLLQL